ncbi:pre-60S ribosomal particles component [Exophiala xenobiotica]|uniref:Pre-60S ribosomal particles component n=1 Tax=Vermiconidia calcicola TaxID=1690605 RepID=A0AAV9Q4L2_9PEZI|nr:pre-60S ribosomal particles component [Exophiala xenobiotica]KAK5532914.1 pre-60S ribosomal particles component [Vermiconidia calcicola]KAK5546644.1 pre-60S ribosomal particles component [Chaetothyriales sp. CCFEE 6169]KAK5296883.1 pre-60S ribosomal particles component [Exophiala xenobiotica]KAK5340132.1 pre-60S ribosomal particles component [Exophiala xenobiotica]
MAPPSQKKRRLEDGMRGKTERPKKRFRKQSEYHSSSEDSNAEDEGGFAAVSLDDSDEGIKARSTPKTKRKSAEQRKKKDGVHSEADAQDQDREDSADQESEQDENISDDDDDDDDANTAGTGANRKRASKRNDPEAFSTSISKILSTKLSKSARKDPVLSRSKQATDTSTSLADEKLERKAKAKLRAERREDLERGRIKDVLGLNSGKAGEIAEEEKRLRKIAQRGVVKLFNAVRAAQVKGEQAAREERKKGTIGIAHREEKVNEMSKQGFLDLIGGKKKTTAVQ